MIVQALCSFALLPLRFDTAAHASIFITYNENHQFPTPAAVVVTIISRTVKFVMNSRGIHIHLYQVRAYSRTG
jgi:hypothetical protein